VHPRRPGDVAACYADCSRALRLLGWRTRYGLHEMCAHAWAWQRDNPRGYSA
jgi:UDP-glucose 4-epimerase